MVSMPCKGALSGGTVSILGSVSVSETCHDLAPTGLGMRCDVYGSRIDGLVYIHQFYPTPEFQRSFRSVFQLIVPIVFLKYGWRWIRYEGPGIEETPADFTCRELIESVKQAKDALPYFLNQVRNNIDGTLVKFPIKTPQGLTGGKGPQEHFD